MKTAKNSKMDLKKFQYLLYAQHVKLNELTIGLIGIDFVHTDYVNLWYIGFLIVFLIISDHI